MPISRSLSRLAPHVTGLLACAALASAGCGASEGGDAGSGGASAARGGTSGQFGGASNGGNTSSGGRQASGGTGANAGTSTGSGGNTAAGGNAAAAGSTAAGGNTGSGGNTAAGGNTSSGGNINAGGNTGSGGAGGALGRGGTTGSGGATTAGGKGGAGGNGAGGSTASGGNGSGGTTGSGGTNAAGGKSSGGTTSNGGTGTGGSTGSGGTGTGGATGCTAPPAASALVGWAAVSGGGVSTTTGGGNATATTVTTLAQLQSAAKGTNAAVIYVKGTLSAGDITVGSNKTIAGICGAEIHGHLELSGSTNVIIRNIKIVGYGVGNCSLDPSYDSSVGCSSGSDAISVQKDAHHVWLDHCDISDGTDGNLDITNGANYVTVSWTKFHYTARTDNNGSDSTGAAGHRYSSLVGGTDSPSGYDDANALNVTWHHNWWADRVMERQPRIRFGHNHLFNNLWSSSGDNYCVRAGKSAHILIENNYFKSVDTPHEFNSSTDQGTAYITATGNTYDATTGTKATGGGGSAYTPSYSYTADAASGVQTAVQNGAGPK